MVRRLSVSKVKLYRDRMVMLNDFSYGYPV